MQEGSLERLRSDMARADRAIARAVERRLTVAARIGHAKQRLRLAVRDYGIEEEVVARWRASLGGLKVSEERAEAFARWLLEESVRVQEGLGETPVRPGRSREILVVGGAGSMGRWLCDFFEAGGHRIAILDPKLRAGASPGRLAHRELEPALRGADAVVVAVPMKAARRLYREIADVRRPSLLFDVLSLKAPILPEIRRVRASGWRVSSAHPLFGPSTRTLSGRNLLILSCGDPGADLGVRALFCRSSLRIRTMPIQAHDALMADVLGLPHTLSLLFSSVLAHRQGTGGRLAEMAPTSFLRQAEIARVVTAENPELAFEIQKLNPHSAELYRRLQRDIGRIRSAVRAGDRSGYSSLLREAREFWARG